LVFWGAGAATPLSVTASASSGRLRTKVAPTAESLAHRVVIDGVGGNIFLDVFSNIKHVIDDL